MWDQYRKTAVWTQTFVVMVCAALYFAMGMPFPAVLLVFVVMQIGAILGAFWGTRLKRRIEESRGRLPLDKR